MLININYWYRKLLLYILVVLSPDATINLILNKTDSHYSFYVILLIDIRNGTLFFSYYFFSQIYIYIFYCKYCTLSRWSYGEVLPITTNLMNLSFNQQMYIQYNIVENHSNYDFPFIYQQHTSLLPSTQLGVAVFDKFPPASFWRPTSNTSLTMSVLACFGSAHPGYLCP